jgi:hypothetical protein
LTDAGAKRKTTKMKSIFTLVAICTASVTTFSQWAGLSIQQEIPVEKRIYNLAVGQTNNDAFPDLITFPFDEFSSVHVFRGDDSEAFSSPVVLQKQEQYRLLNAADIDHDGIDDLILSSYWGNGFRIYWGSANGEYEEGEHYGLTGHGKNIAIEDMNGDGKLDIIAFSGGSGQPITLHFYLGTNSRAIIPNGIFSSVLHTDMRITIVDKNQDGLKDIMVATSFPWFIIFYQQNGGAYKPQYWPWDVDLSESFTSEYHMADFNNDSKEDLLAFHYDEGFRIYEGLQDTLFSSTYRSVSTAPRLGKIFTTDLNLDGKVDIVMENYTMDYEPTEAFYYLLGNGDFTFSEPVLFDVGAPVDRMIVSDFNADDFPDIIIYSGSQKIITVMNDGIVAGSEDPLINVSVYPNPFTDVLQLEFASYPAKVNVFDSQGKVRKVFTATEKIALQTLDWAEGLYIVRTTYGKKITTLKVQKN